MGRHGLLASESFVRTRSCGGAFQSGRRPGISSGPCAKRADL